MTNEIHKELKKMMIQEVLGGSGAAGGHGLIGGEKKIYPLTGKIELPSPSPSPSPSPTCSTNTTATPTQISSENQNQNQLRCPRCDSSNTKFCYYNNYNLTQPRHFCKTCRRYWTKGGALRNVPIGGGCRKNHKTSTVGHVIPSLGKSSTRKCKTTVSSEIGKPSRFLSGFDHHVLSSNPVLRASPQGSHLMALLRSAQNPNPSPNSMLNSVSVKEECFLSGSHINSEPWSASGALNTRADGLGLHPQVTSIGLCSNSFWRNNSQNQLAEQQQQNGFMLGEIQSKGLIPDQLCQRLSLKSSVNYYSDYSPDIHVGNVHASSSANSSATILESTPVVAGGDLGNYWNNPSFSWSDLQTTNGAYH